MSELFSDRGTGQSNGYQPKNESFDKLTEAIYDVRDRVTRMEEKLNRVDRMENKTEVIEKKADEATTKANEALIVGKQNEKSIENINTTLKWGIGTMIGLIMILLAILGFFVK